MEASILGGAKFDPRDRGHKLCLFRTGVSRRRNLFAWRRHPVVPMRVKQVRSPLHFSMIFLLLTLFFDLEVYWLEEVKCLATLPEAEWDSEWRIGL